MRLVRFIRQWLRDVWEAGLNLSAGPDSHKWETKIEIMGNLSPRHH